MQHAIRGTVDQIAMALAEPRPALVVCATPGEGLLVQRLMLESRRLSKENGIFVLLSAEGGLARIYDTVSRWKNSQGSLLIVTLEVMKVMAEDGIVLTHHREAYSTFIGMSFRGDISGLSREVLGSHNKPFRGFDSALLDSFTVRAVADSDDEEDAPKAKTAAKVCKASAAVREEAKDDSDYDEDDEDDEKDAPTLPPKSAPKIREGSARVLPVMSGPWPRRLRQQLIPNVLAVLARSIQATSEGRKVVIVCRASSVVEWMSRALEEQNVTTFRLTASTPRKDMPLEAFKKGGPSVLICTDVIRGGGLAISGGPSLVEVYSVYPINPLYRQSYESRFNRVNNEAPVLLRLWLRNDQAPLLSQEKTVKELGDKIEHLEAVNTHHASILETNKLAILKMMDSEKFLLQKLRDADQNVVDAREALAARGAELETASKSNVGLSCTNARLLDDLQAAHDEIARLRAQLAPSTIAQQLRDTASGADAVYMSGVQYENLLQFVESIELIARDVKVSPEVGQKIHGLANQVLKDSKPE